MRVGWVDEQRHLIPELHLKWALHSLIHSGSEACPEYLDVRAQWKQTILVAVILFPPAEVASPVLARTQMFSLVASGGSILGQESGTAAGIDGFGGGGTKTIGLKYCHLA